MASYFLQQIAYSAPLLLVYVIAAALAVIFLRKHPLSSMLALAGALILLITGIGVVIGQITLVRQRVESGWSVTYYNQMLMIVNAVGTVFRTLGTMLLVAAIFAGRKNRATDDAV